MAVPLTEQSVLRFAEHWVAALDEHVDFLELARYAVTEGLAMRFPDGVFRELDVFAKWYDMTVHRYFDERHTFVEVRPAFYRDWAAVQVKVNWQARTWQPPAAASTWLCFDVDQTWELVTGDDGPLLRTYVVEHLEPMPGSGSL